MIAKTTEQWKDMWPDSIERTVCNYTTLILHEDGILAVRILDDPGEGSDSRPILLTAGLTREGVNSITFGIDGYLQSPNLERLLTVLQEFRDVGQFWEIFEQDRGFWK